VPARQNTIRILPLGQEAAGRQLAQQQEEGTTEKHELANGLTVLVKRLPTVPIVTMQAYMLGGVLGETDETAGLSNLTAAMLDKGTERYTAQEIAAYFDSVGGSLSSTAGRNTSYVTATVLKEDFAQAAEFFSQCVLHPTFPAQEYTTVQNLALGAIAQRQASPQAEAFEFFYDNLPSSSPYHLPQGGKAETVAKLTAEDVRRFHQAYYVPNNMVVSVFGDVEPEAALAMVEQHFGAVERDPGFRAPAFSALEPMSSDVRRHKQTRKQAGMVVMGYPAVSILEEKDYTALTVLDAIMSGYSYPGGWLHTELRGEGLVYYVHAFQLTGPVPGYFAVLSQTSPDTVDEVVRRIQANVEKARNGDISEDEFQRAKEMVVSLHALENTTAQEQAQQAALDERYGLGYDYSRSFDDRIEGVSLEQVVAVARRYLTHCLIATTSPEAAVAGGQ
jgi:zinc protease